MMGQEDWARVERGGEPEGCMRCQTCRRDMSHRPLIAPYFCPAPHSNCHCAMDTHRTHSRPHWPHWTMLAHVLGLLVLVVHSSEAFSYPPSVTGFYTDDTAQQSVLLDRRISPRQKKEIRDEILHLLGLEHKPRVQNRLDSSSAPQYMLELYRTLEEDDMDREYSRKNTRLLDLNLTMSGMENNLGTADLIMSFINQASLRRLYTDGGRRFYFDFSDVPLTEGATGAELRVYKYNAPWMYDREPFTIRLFSIESDGFSMETAMELDLNLTVSALDEGWMHINVTRAVQRWLGTRHGHITLYMEVTDVLGRDLEPAGVGIVDNAGPADKQAFLVAYFKANHRLHVRKSRALHSRSRRSPSPSSYYSDEKDYGWVYPADRGNRRACQRRALYVSFRALGWESWVIAPEGYHAFYCQGECMFPLNNHMNATNHAIVQALVHLVKPTLAPNPCCAPTTLNAISFLYLDNNYNVVLKKYMNMVVQACGCH